MNDRTTKSGDTLPSRPDQTNHASGIVSGQTTATAVLAEEHSQLWAEADSSLVAMSWVTERQNPAAHHRQSQQ